MEIEENGGGEETATAMQVYQIESSSPTQETSTSSFKLPSVDTDTDTDNHNVSENGNSYSNNSNITQCALHMAFPCTDPPRQQTVVQPLPSTINFPKLSFIHPTQPIPIDLSADIVRIIEASFEDREISRYLPTPSRSRAVLSICRHHPRPARKHVFSKLRVAFISDKQFLTAVRNADSSKVLYYLEEGADPNISDSKGRTPLHIAASQGLSDIACNLLSWRADPNRKDILENTPLHLAVCRGDTRVVSILLKNGANINLTDGVGRTPLGIVQSRLGTLRRDRSISTDKLINECLIISDILRIQFASQQYRSSTQADVHIAATEDVLSSSAINDLCSMMKTISTREQADEIADTMIETMSQMHIRQAEEEQQRKYSLPIL